MSDKNILLVLQSLEEMKKFSKRCFEEKQKFSRDEKV